jgi:hypothetical protein
VGGGRTRLGTGAVLRLQGAAWAPREGTGGCGRGARSLVSGQYAGVGTGRYGMKEGELRASLERAEEAYEELVRTRASLGSMLAAAIRRDGGLPEFRRRMQDLPFLIRSADIKRTALKVELLGRRLQEAKKVHHRSTEETKRAGSALEEARRAYARAVNVEQRSSLEVQRTEELHRGELGRLERLRSETEQQEEEKEVAAP